MPTRIKILLLISLAVLFISSCSEDGPGSRPGDCAQPGVVLTFDDDSVDNWHSQRDLFNEYGAKATFFVSNVGSFPDGKIEQLRDLNSDGHEIGSHGYKHVGVDGYAETGHLQEYLDEIILPSLDTLRSWGFEVNTFAYPYGKHTNESDELLLKHFKFLRYSPGLTDTEEVFYHCGNNEKVLDCVWVDNGGNSEGEINRILEVAKTRKKVLILCAHTPDDQQEGAYFISSAKLKFILETARDKGLKFYTMSKLDEIPRTQYSPSSQ